MTFDLTRFASVVAPPPSLFAGKTIDIPAISQEIAWLKTLTNPSGWIAAAPDKVNVRPYMGNYAAYGFVRAGEVLGDTTLFDYAARWINWYGSHINADGFMHDWSITSGSILTDLGSDSMDSTDAYPGTLMLVVWRYWSAGGDMSKINGLESLLNLCIDSIVATQDIDGLTWAKLTYLMKYLEDNIEGLVGLRACAIVATAMGLSSTHAAAQTAADKLATGISYMLNLETSTYDFAIDQFGTRTFTNWSDENHQRQHVWAVAYGAQDATLSNAFMTQYESHFSTWDRQTDPWEIMPVWAYARLGNRARVRQALANLRGNIVSTARAWPYNGLYAGQLIAALGGVKIPPLGIPALDRINLLPNPGFTTDSNSDGLADGLSAYGSPTTTIVSGTAYGNAQRVDVPAGNGWDVHYTDHLAVTPGKWYTLSHYSKIERLDSGGQHVLKIEWYKNDGSLSAITPYRYNIYNTVDSGFVRRWLSVLAPADAASCGLFLAIENGGKVQFARVKFEVAGAPTPW